MSRALGIKYICIDSLCILQGSSEAYSLNNEKGRSFYLTEGLQSGCIIDCEDLMADWKTVITGFPRPQLSLSSDRLAALAYLAARAHTSQPEVKYLAGLLRNTLPQSLIWEARERIERVRPCIAPSWSGASVTGPVTWPLQQFFNTRGRTRLETIDCNSPPAIINICRALKDASFSIRSSYYDSESLLETGGRFMFRNIVVFVYFLVLRLFHDSKGNSTFERVCKLFRTRGFDPQEQPWNWKHQTNLVLV